MADLRTLQRSLWSVLTAPSGRGSVGAPDAERTSLESMVRGDGRGSARARLDVYANMYLHRLCDNLAADFPRVAAVLGARAFHALSTDYLAAHPSRSSSVRELGRALPGFVRAHRGAAARPWLADLAALEWARLDVFDRADQPLLTLARLQAAAATGFAALHLQAVAAHERVRVDHDVTSLWRRAGEGVAADTPQRARGVLLVWRQPDALVHHRPVAAEEAALLDALAHGIEFTALCARLSKGRADDAAAREALALVSSWTAAGLLVDDAPRT